jgi:putative phosphoribosyl transferase
MKKTGMFEDRDDAARQLAEKLDRFRGEDTVVVGLARGGVVLAYRLARILGASLDVLVVRKIGAPWNPELAIGAITDGASPRVFLNDGLIERMEVDQAFIDRIVAKESATMRERNRIYSQHYNEPEMRDCTVIITDDGIATGSTVQVAIRAIRDRRPRTCVLAVPVAAPQTLERLRPSVDQLICLDQPHDFRAISLYYRNFSQVSDEEVADLLDRFYQPGSSVP